MGPCFKSPLSYKFYRPETIRDRAKMNSAGPRVWRLSGKYFESLFKDDITPHQPCCLFRITSPRFQDNLMCNLRYRITFPIIVMNLLVLTRAVKSGIPERAFVKKSYGRSLALTPTPPLVVFFFIPLRLSPRSERLETGYHLASACVLHLHCWGNNFYERACATGRWNEEEGTMFVLKLGL